MNGIQEVSGSIPLSSTNLVKTINMRIQILKNILPLLLLLYLISLAGCKDTVAGNEDIDSIIIPNSNVSFSKYIFPVFNVKCATAGCHDDGSRAGDLSLTSWANATIDPSIIFPGKPDNSKLVWTIEGQAGIAPMPPIGFVRPLTPNQIKGIKIWISEGAQSN